VGGARILWVARVAPPSGQIYLSAVALEALSRPPLLGAVHDAVWWVVCRRWSSFCFPS